MRLTRKNKGLNLTVLAFKDSMQLPCQDLQPHWDLPTLRPLLSLMPLLKKRPDPCKIFQRVHARTRGVFSDVDGDPVAMP